MALRRLTDATVEPITLSDLKAHLRVTDSAQDAYLTQMITTARQDVEDNRLRRTLITTTWELTLDAFPDVIKLPMPRVIAVSSLKYVDVNGVLQTLNSTLYKVNDRSEPGTIVPAFGQVWPQTQNQINGVVVTYTAGYSADATLVPAPIKHWLYLACGSMYENREAEMIPTRAVVPVALDFAKRLLDVYRVFEY